MLREIHKQCIIKYFSNHYPNYANSYVATFDMNLRYTCTYIADMVIASGWKHSLALWHLGLLLSLVASPDVAPIL